MSVARPETGRATATVRRLLAGLTTLDARTAQQLAVLLLRHALTALLDHRAHGRSLGRRRSRCPAQRPTGGAHRHERFFRLLVSLRGPCPARPTGRAPPRSPPAGPRGRRASPARGSR